MTFFLVWKERLEASAYLPATKTASVWRPAVKPAQLVELLTPLHGLIINLDPPEKLLAIVPISGNNERSIGCGLSSQRSHHVRAN